MVRDEAREDYLSDNTIDRISRLLPSEETLRRLVSFYAVFSDVTRIRIISALAMREMCVGDLADVVGCHQSTVSHQLKYLLSEGIVGYRRSGKMIYYYIDNLLVDDVMSLGVENIEGKARGKY